MTLLKPKKSCEAAAPGSCMRSISWWFRLVVKAFQCIPDNGCWRLKCFKKCPWHIPMNTCGMLPHFTVKNDCRLYAWFILPLVVLFILPSMCYSHSPKRENSGSWFDSSFPVNTIALKLCISTSRNRPWLSMSAYSKLHKALTSLQRPQRDGRELGIRNEMLLDQQKRIN